jgi:hypothetical protein
LEFVIGRVGLGFFDERAREFLLQR